MTDYKSYTGVVQEISQTADNPRAPRKVMVNDGGEFSKTFRCWPFADKDSDTPSPEFALLEEALNKEVTIWYEEENKGTPPKTWTQNTVRSIGEAPSGNGRSQNSQKTYGGVKDFSPEQYQKIEQFFVTKMREWGIFQLVGDPGDKPAPPDYQKFKESAEKEGFNENGLEKRWDKFKDFGWPEAWCQATQDQLEAFATKDLGFTFA